MSQLLVRDLEPAVVRKLRTSAADQGISMEEAHRRLLRAALLGRKEPGPSNFLAFLRSIPKGRALECERAQDLPREISF